MPIKNAGMRRSWASFHAFTTYVRMYRLSFYARAKHCMLA